MASAMPSSCSVPLRLVMRSVPPKLPGSKSRNFASTSVPGPTTKGDFALATLDWHADLRWFVAGKNGAVGSEYRQSFYKAEGGFDDWSAQSLFVYWRQVF